MPKDNGETEQKALSGQESDGPNGEPVDSIPNPLATLPGTKLPVQFNQQVNVYNIPQSAWDRLNPDQVMELTKVILEQADATDKRHFEFAMNEAKLEDHGKKLSMKIGLGITVAGFAGAVALGFYGHELASLAVSLPITTILAVIVGNRFIG